MFTRWQFARRQAMKSQAMAVAAALALAMAGSADAGDDDRAVPRGGSSGGSSSAGERHHGGGGSSSGSGSSSGHAGSSSSSDSGSSGAWSAPPLTDAQRRHPRAGTGTGHDRRSSGGFYDPRAYYWYDPYYSGFGSRYGYYSPFYYSGFYGYYPYLYNRRAYSSYRTGSVRVMVEPADTRVYVDGYYAGVADDFDGLFQRLNISPGRHEVALKLEGHRTFKVKVYVPLDQTVKIRHRMAQGSGEDVSEDVVGRPDNYARYEERRDRDDEYADDEAELEEGDEGPAGDGGTLRLLVSPADASVYVDGDFKGTVRQLRRLRLSPGKHRVELVRPGFRTLEREVEIRAGRATDLELSLDRS
jgi:hypothetical protein